MFFTAGSAGGDPRRGLGHGLALSRSIEEARGGSIGDRPNQPPGSVFFFTLQAEDVEHYE